MTIRRFKEYTSKKVFKTFLGLFVYFVCTFYAVSLYNHLPFAYKTAQAFVNEKFLSNKRRVVIGNTTLLVDIADTQAEREKGLSGREPLVARTGMLFIFDKPDTYGFWMKEMNFNIDIIWFNEYGEIIYVVQDAKPESYPETFMPPKKSLYVLETQSGFVKKEGLKIGDKIDLY